MNTASCILAFLSLAALHGHSATVEISVKDARGAAIEDAVVWVAPKGGNAPVRRRDAAVESMSSIRRGLRRRERTAR